MVRNLKLNFTNDFISANPELTMFIVKAIGPILKTLVIEKVQKCAIK